MKDMLSIEKFHEYFHTVIACSQELRTEVYQLRYKVYCQEFHYEKEEEHPGHEEHDAYDEHSIHCVIIHKASGKTAGCVRLVLPNPENPRDPLPFEKYCADSLDRDIINPTTLPRNSFGEISRLAVLADFRRRHKEHETPIGLAEETAHDGTERRHFPYIPVGLYLSAASLGLLAGLDSVFAMMEPRLARHIYRFGIKPLQVGKIIDYHGPRAPFYINRHMFQDGLKPEIQLLLQNIKSDLEKDIARIKPGLLKFPVVR